MRNLDIIRAMHAQSDYDLGLIFISIVVLAFIAVLVYGFLSSKLGHKLIDKMRSK